MEPPVCAANDVASQPLTPVSHGGSQLRPVQLSQQGSQPQVPKLVPATSETKEPLRSGTKHRISAHLVNNMRSKKLRHYQVQELEYPSSGVNGQPGNKVRVRFYQGDVEGPAPLVIILPIWGTFDYPVEKLSLRLRKRFKGKVHIALFLGKNRLIKWPEIAASDSREELLQQSRASAEQVRVASADIRGLLRWARSQEKIDPERIILSGFSIGAIVGSIVTVEEPALLGTTLVMGAVNPADVLTYCNRIAGDSRLTVMETLNMSLQQYENTMHQAFDALDWTRQSAVVDDPSRFLVVDAHRDDCMPQQARDALWLGLGKPERYTLQGSHQGAFLSMTMVGLNYTSKLLVDYIDGRFDELDTAESQKKPGNAEDPGAACSACR